MDDSKVQAVLNWPKPTTVKELQRFLGFANFYRRFIRNFSMVAAPLTSLLQGGKQRLNWTQASEQSFRQLKERFTSAPILHHPNPDLEFTVEVDASNTGIGAVLSQRQGSPLKLFPCAFYSRKLNPAERNYDVGDRELLAMKAAFEEWRHWLEGAKLPFLVLTDHRNLEYIRSAKRLNPRQARWSLFFSRFDFKVTYRPGSKNGKADALSRQFDHLPTSNVSEPILPSKVILAPVRWDLMTEISEALISDPAPAKCPPDLTYVPSDFRPRVMRWVHELPSAGHPGINATIQLVSNRFWWSTLPPDVTVRSAMWSLQYFQIRPSSSSRSPTVSSHSSTTLVPYCNRFRNRPTQFQSLHHNTHGYWPILQGLPINPPHETTHSIWNGRSTAYFVCYSYHFRRLFYSNASALRSGHHTIFLHDSSSKRTHSIHSALKCARREFKLYIFTDVYDVTLVRA